MFHANSKLNRSLLLIALMLGAGLPACAQMSALRQGDDQFIQGLQEQGMSELLDRFAETTPPEDPIAALTLSVAIKDFVAGDLLANANTAFQNGEVEQANELFLQSRQRFEEMLDFQRQLIEDHNEDERVPLWETDLAQMLLLRYLPTYHQNVTWHYEYGMPTAEQKEVYESVMTEALQVTDDATYRLDLLVNRLGRMPNLQAELEEQGLLYKLRDYTTLNTPYWYGTAAHGVMIFPEDHPYFAGGVVRNQRGDVEAERTRLRNIAVESFSGQLANDRRFEDTAKLVSGQTLVWSSNRGEIDEGIELLEDVRRDNSNDYMGYLATLSNAVGLWNSGQLEDATDILSGIGDNQFVRQDATTLTRLLAADLMFRILTEEAAKAPAAEQQGLISAAYTDAYVPLIESGDSRYGQILFSRWASEFDEDANPASLPQAVRMGIGQQYTQQGYIEANQALQMQAAQAPTLEEAREWEQQYTQLAESARENLGRANQFNETLTGEDMEAGPVLATALSNLAISKYMLGRLELIGGDPNNWRPFLEAAQLWLAVAQRVEDSERAQESVRNSIQTVLQMETAANKERVTQPEIRAVYQQCFELLLERWPNDEVTHNNRLYAGFHLYEKQGLLQEAAEVYRELPNTHRDYYQAGRQMLYAMRTSYRRKEDQRRLMLAQQPPDDIDRDAPAAERAALEQAQDAWELEFARLNENIVREREALTEAAQLLEADARVASARGSDAQKKFTAATALGASLVVLSGVKSDLANIEGDNRFAREAVELLDGFEDMFDPREGEFAPLAEQQSNPGNARATLQGLIQSAQEQRILAMLEANQPREMAEQARVMMAERPEGGRFVVSGVMRRIEAMIQTQERALRAASFEQQERAARQKIERYATAAMVLAEILRDWAEDQDDIPAEQMVAYELPLIDAQMMTGVVRDLNAAIAKLDELNEAHENTQDIMLRRGKAYLRRYQDTHEVDDYNESNAMFNAIISAFNNHLEKPAVWWDAWLHTMLLLEATGEKRFIDVIPQRARVLQGIDPDFGGDRFKDRFLEVIDRNGGIELLTGT